AVVTRGTPRGRPGRSPDTGPARRTVRGWSLGVRRRCPGRAQPAREAQLSLEGGRAPGDDPPGARSVLVTTGTCPTLCPYDLPNRPTWSTGAPHMPAVALLAILLRTAT